MTGEGIAQLRGRLAEAVRAARASGRRAEQFVVHRPVRGGATGSSGRAAAGWSRAARPARAVALSDLTHHDALDEAHRPAAAPRRRPGAGPGGAQPGDSVRIGGLVFDYQDEGDAPPVIVVAKVGTSSITGETGEIDEAAIAKFCTEVATLREPATGWSW